MHLKHLHLWLLICFDFILPSCYLLSIHFLCFLFCCFPFPVLGKTLESPLDCKEIQPVHSEGDQPWVFFGRNDAKAETPVLWPPHAKSWLIGKDPDAGRDWGQEEKGTTEDEMAGWHHWLDGRESVWTPGVGDGQEAWCVAIHGVAKIWTRLKDWIEPDQGPTLWSHLILITPSETPYPSTIL